LDYGKEHADVIMNTAGNVVAGQMPVIGQIYLPRSVESGELINNRTDTSIYESKQLEAAVPASYLGLSSGDFPSMIANNPGDCKIDLKVFHFEIINDHEVLNNEITGYRNSKGGRLITPLYSEIMYGSSRMSRSSSRKLQSVY
jgi:hypothetical protein